MNKEAQTTAPTESVSQVPSNAPDASSNAAQAQQSSTTLINLLSDVAVNVIVSAVVALLIIKFAVPWINPELEKPTSTGFVVVNFEVLAREQILAMGEKVRAGTMDANEMTVRSSRFTQEAIDRVKAYTSEGKVVLRSDAVFAMPEGVEDVTDSLREALIKAGAMDKPVSRPTTDK